jgi:hypothetical protein
MIRCSKLTEPDEVTPTEDDDIEERTRMVSVEDHAVEDIAPDRTCDTM